MRFRMGVATGFAAGYVMGSKAGYERYEQIRAAFDQFMGSETARHLESGAREAWEAAKEEFPGVQQVGQQVGQVLDLHGRLDDTEQRDSQHNG